jgi:polar amino acid transport system substrate-binding protein
VGAGGAGDGGRSGGCRDARGRRGRLPVRDPGLPPYEYLEDGKVKGLAVEIIREVFQMRGKEVSFEVYPWARSIEMFKGGGADGIFSFFKTPERAAYTRFSRQVLITQPITLWVPRASRLESATPLAQFAGRTFGVVHMVSYGTAFDEAVRKGRLRTDESYTAESCINNLLAGRFDIWVSNHYGAVWALRKAGRFDEVRELAPPLQETPAYVGFSRVRDLGRLRDEFDRNLALLKESGKYQKIIDAYMESLR